MEQNNRSINQNIMPEIRLFPTLDKIAGFIGRVVSLGRTTELCLTEHKRGAAAMLDEALDNQPELPFSKMPVIERTDLGQLNGGWDDMGNYYSPYIDRSRS